MAKKNSSILWTVDQTGDVIGKDGREKAQKNVGLGSEFVKTSKTDKNYVTHVTRESNGELKVNVAQPSLSDLQGLGSGDKNKSIVTNNDGNIVAVALSAEQIDQTSTQTDINFVSGVTEDGNGKIHVTTKKITTATESTAGITTLKSDIFYENTKDKSTNVSVTPAGVWDAIESLDVSSITGFGAGKTLASLTETDGKIAATFQDIAIGGSAITLGTASVAVVTDSSKHLSTQDLSVSSPSASGNTNAFIDTISQSATGKISVTKKTLSVATSSNVGGVKSTTTGTTANRDYNVEVNSDGTMKVNVPWENTHYASKTVICKSSSGTANAEVTASDTAYMNHVENSAVVSSHKIIGDGFKVTSDSNGHMTLTSPITERSGLYSVEGHYPIVWSQDTAGDQRLYVDYQSSGGETIWTGYLVPSPVNHQGDILMYKNNAISWVTPDPVTVTTYSDVRELSSSSTGLKTTSMELITGNRSSQSYNMHIQYNDGNDHIKDAYFPLWGLKSHSDVLFEYTHEPRISTSYDGTPYSVNTSQRFDDIANIYYSNTTSGYVFKEGDVFFAPIDTDNKYNERHQLVYVKKDVSLSSRTIPQWFDGEDASEYLVKNRLFELVNNGRSIRKNDKSRPVSIMEHFIDYWADRSITDGDSGRSLTYPIKSVSVTATNDYGHLSIASRTVTAPSPGGGSADYNTSASFYLLNTQQGEGKQYGFVYLETGNGNKHLTVKQLPLPRSLGGTYTFSGSDGSVEVGSYYNHKVTLSGHSSAQYIYIDNNGKSGYYWRYSDSSSASTHGQISGDRQPFSFGASDFTNHVKMEIYCNYSDCMVHIVAMPEGTSGGNYIVSLKVEWLTDHE